MTKEVDFLTEAMMGIFEASNIVTLHKWQMFCEYVIICLYELICQLRCPGLDFSVDLVYFIGF